MRDIVTSTNNEYFYILYYNNGSFESKSYERKIDGIEQFVNHFKESAEIVRWGQFIMHHKEDEWQKDTSEVLFVLGEKDK